MNEYYKLLDNLLENEKVLGVFENAIGLSNEFFNKKDPSERNSLAPAVIELILRCEDVIKEPGIFRLRVLISRMK